MAESKLARLRQYYREGGAELVLQVAFYNGYLPERMCHYSVSDLFRLRALDDRLLRRMRGDYLFSDATRADAEAQSLLAWGDAPAKRIDYLAGLTEEQRIVKVTSGDALIGFLQIFQGEYDLSRDDYRASSLRLVLEPDDVFLGYGFIDPAHRLKGISPFLIRHAIQTSAPGSRFFTSIARLNSGSRKAHLRLGFELAGSVRAWLTPAVATRWSLLAPDGGPPAASDMATPASPSPPCCQPDAAARLQRHRLDQHRRRMQVGGGAALGGDVPVDVVRRFLAETQFTFRARPEETLERGWTVSATWPKM